MSDLYQLPLESKVQTVLSCKFSDFSDQLNVLEGASIPPVQTQALLKS